MASFARSVGLLARPRNGPACVQGRRSFHLMPSLQSGHNKWSKIRHEKAAADKKKGNARALIAKNIILYSKLYGPDPAQNVQLAHAIAIAKRNNCPKSLVEDSIARGQGKSLKGASLENLTFEIMMPPGIALMIEVETESKGRVIQHLNDMVKRRGGTTTGAKFLFTRAGRVVFAPGDSGLSSIDDIMDDAIEAGAEDLETDADGNMVVWTEPTQTMQVCQGLASKLKLKVLSSDIVWTANEDTKAELQMSNHVKELENLLVALREDPDIQAIYSNASQGSLTDEEWARIEEHLDL